MVLHIKINVFLIKESNEKKSKESIPKISHLSMQHRTELIKCGHPNKIGTPVEAPVNDKKVSKISDNEGHKTFSSLKVLS